MSVFQNFTIDELRLKLFPLAKRLKELSSEEKYDYEYHSIHSAIGSLVRRRSIVINYKALNVLPYVKDIFDDLSYEEQMYVESPPQFFSWPEIIVNTKNFKSPMKYTYTMEKSWRMKGMERVSGCLTPLCVIYFIQNPCEEYEITDDMLEEIQDSDAYCKLAIDCEDPIRSMDLWIKSLDVQERVYTYDNDFSYAEGFISRFEKIKNRLAKAESLVALLSNRPPHHIQCDKCGNELEIRCSEETDHKEHVDSIKT